MTLTEFLLARIAEDEEVARAASTLPMRNPAEMDEWTQVPGEPAEWVTGDGYGSGAVERTNGDPHEVGIVVYDEGSPSESEAAHIARHDPARVLRRCEADRRIVEWHTETEDCCEERWGPMQWATDENISAGTDALGNLSIRRDIGGEEWLGCVTLAYLAQPYADHPDYRDEWRP